MKTAVSIPDELFKEVDKLAKERKTSRSRIFSEAVQFYLEKIKSRKLLKELNAAYSKETQEERRLRKKSKEYYKSRVLKKADDHKTG
ncbi:MAG: ribbon-helix-helix protein, CopG family [Candidatus Aminicenantes bacterium]